MINYKNFVENSRKWLEDYIKTNHLESLIIGISGGIDSTVSCAIASPVCEKLNIPLVGRSLPTSTNKAGENDAAKVVGTAFCKDFKEVNIQHIYESVLGLIHLEESQPNLLQCGNIKARLRMIYLRHLASKHKGVVLDNDNFTEWNLGFWTVGGDSPMDINLGLHYLWKTEIYDLAKYLIEQMSRKYDDVTRKFTREFTKDDIKDIRKIDALNYSLSLTPTDGNGISDSDCDQFGLEDYEQVDDVLKTIYYNNKRSIPYAYNVQGVDKVILLHQNTAYKRESFPIMPTKKELEL